MLTAQILQSLIHTEKVILIICLNRAKKKTLINEKDRLNRRPFFNGDDGEQDIFLYACATREGMNAKMIRETSPSSNF